MVVRDKDEEVSVPGSFPPAVRAVSDHGQAMATPATSMDRKVSRRPRLRLKRLLLPLLVVLVLAAGVVAFEVVPSAGTLVVKADDLTFGTATYAPFQDYLPIRAVVAPLRTVYIGAVEGGTVAQVPMLDGSIVKAGDVLATLANPQLRLDVSSREAAVASQLSDVSAQRLSLQQTLTAENGAIAETRYNLVKAERELTIREQLHDQGFESDAGVKSFSDEASYYRSRLATLTSARNTDKAVAARQADEIDQTAFRLKASLDEVEKSLDALTLRAPLAGRLTGFVLEPGQTIKQGDAIGQIDSEGKWRLNADVDEFYLGRILEEQPATAEVDGRELPLVVSRVRPQVVNGQFRVELTFGSSPKQYGSPEDGSLSLHRGESVEIKITLGQTQRALVVPNGPWFLSSGGNAAFVVDSGGRGAIRRGISVGRRNPDQVEIIAGVKAGERVVSSSYATYQNFKRLQID